MPLGERGLARSRRSEQDDGLRWGDGVAAGEVRLGEGKDDPPLDDRLRLLHALQLLPESPVDHPSADLIEGGR
jgi:hypothetical protein